MPLDAPLLAARLGTGSSPLPFDTGTRSKGARKTMSGTGSRSVLPMDDDEKKSLTMGRYQFRKDGAGWECREIIGKGAARKRPYLAHLSRARYEEMRTDAGTREELERELIEWADMKKLEKGTR